MPASATVDQILWQARAADPSIDEEIGRGIAAHCLIVLADNPGLNIPELARRCLSESEDTVDVSWVNHVCVAAATVLAR